MHHLTPYQIEALNYKKHIALTANAGSGKTFVLSKRYIEICLNEDLPINKIVAITFTDKAAGELYKKIANEIENRLQSENISTVKKKLERIRKQLVSANISTIHSFCINLLREYSPDAGIDANFSPMDSETSDELIELSIEEVILSRLKDESIAENVKYLIRILGSKSSLLNQLKQLIYQRKNVLKLEDEFYSKSIDDLAEFYEKIFNEKFQMFFDENLKTFISNLEHLNNNLIINAPDDEIGLEVKSDIDRFKKSNTPIEKIKLVHSIGNLIFTQKNTLKKREFIKKIDSSNFESNIALIEDNYNILRSVKIDDNYKSANRELAKFGKTILEIFNEVLNIYEEKKNDKGYLDFEDILLYTKKIVKIESVKEKLSQKYSYIMLDEYQDTNEIQYEIFMPILENLNTGNLFVVGDEKQSIYMFRDAEIEIFSRTRNEIKNKETETSLLQLPHSFRMSPPIAAFTNELFGELFKNPREEFNEVTPNELICSKEEEEKGSIEIIVADVETESELISKRIIKLLNENPSLDFKDVAVLCRKRNAFTELENSFSKFNIPFSIIGGKGYYQRQIIYDVYNYLSFLINPENDASLVGILRSPFFTISDANIYEISLMPGNTFWEKFKEYVLKENKFNGILEKLNQHLSFALRIDLNLLLRKILNDTNYWVVISSKPNSYQEIANLNKLLRISNSYLQQGLKTIYDFVNYLAEAMETLDDEGQASVSKDENTVKIMTIHQAKGLEYKAVFIYKCADYSKDEIVKTKSVNVDKEFGILTKLPVEGNYFEEYSTPPVAGIYNYLTNKKLSAEAKRLFYVAVTRAVNFLFISYSVNARTSDTSFISFIEQGLKIDLESEIFVLNSKLKFMSSHQDNYKIYLKEISIEIPIVKSVENYGVIKKNEPGTGNADRKISVIENTDKVKNEIVSATKTAMYLQCPLKYKLTYELGYTKILKVFDKRLSTFEFNFNEDDDINEYGDLRGRIIHSVLEQEVNTGNLFELVKTEAEKEFELNSIDEGNTEEIINSICADLNRFFNSKVYKEIKSYKKYFNEYEIYTKQYDYYLYGIIDKIVIKENEILIIDYKTDNIQKEKIEERGINYLPQLKFYALLASRRFEGTKKIICRLVFIKHPESIFEKEFGPDEIAEFNDEVKTIIYKIRENDFPPELSHCQVCHFAVDNGKCIMPAH